MNLLRVLLLVVGGLPVPGCRERAPETPAAASSAVAAPGPVSAAPSPSRRAPGQAVERAPGGAPTAVPADTSVDTATRSVAGGPLLLSERTLRRGRGALLSARARAGAQASLAARATGPGRSVGARDITASDSLPQAAPPSGPPGTRSITPLAILVYADHRVDPGTGTERTASLLFGAGFEATTRGWLSVRGEIVTGTLAAREPGVRDRAVTDARLDLGVAASSWLTLLAGGGLRVYKQDAQENWRFLRVGAEARFPLGVDALTGMVRFTLCPLVSRATGAPSTLSPSYALGAASGLRLTRRRLSVDVEYAIESYAFPSSGGLTRLEQFSQLKVGVGLNLAW